MDSAGGDAGLRETHAGSRCGARCSGSRTSIDAAVRSGTGGQPGTHTGSPRECAGRDAAHAGQAARRRQSAPTARRISAAERESNRRHGRHKQPRGAQEGGHRGPESERCEFAHRAREYELRCRRDGAAGASARDAVQYRGVLRARCRAVGQCGKEHHPGRSRYGRRSRRLRWRWWLRRWRQRVPRESGLARASQCRVIRQRAAQPAQHVQRQPVLRPR